MSRSRRARTGLWIVVYSDGTSGRIVAKTDKAALKRALKWCEGQGTGITVTSCVELI